VELVAEPLAVRLQEPDPVLASVSETAEEWLSGLALELVAEPLAVRL